MFQIESELKRTRRELENTKNALKHQVARCRHLVSAFSKRLAEKDVELKYCKETREKQLSAVIRALLVLESRLRREQKSIRTMLAERDELIKSQCEEIARLEAGHDPDWADKLAARDAIITAHEEEVARLRNLLKSSSDSPEKSEKAIKSLQDDSDRLSLIDGLEERDNIDINNILEEKDALIKYQHEEIKRLQSLSASNERKDQEDLRTLLSERDALIKFQQDEIERLRSLSITESVNESKEVSLTKIDEIAEEDIPNVECYAKPDLISSLCIDGQDEKESSTESVTEVTCQPDSLSSDAASTRACLGDNDADSLCNCTITPPVVRGGLSVHDRSAFSPVPRSSHKYDSDTLTPNVFNTSVPDISKSDYNSRFDAPVSSFQDPHGSFYSSNIRPSPSSARVSMRSFDVNYQDNPVLQCVNQILLKDPDDIMEDQRSNKLPSIESPFVEIDDADQPFWLSNSTEEETTADTTTQTLEDSPKPALATSSPLEKVNIQDNNPPKGSKLSLSKLIELHNAARKLFPSRREHDGRKSVSMSDLSSAVLTPRLNPPVPPKPRKSNGKKVDFTINRPVESKSADSSFQNPKTVLPPQPVYIDRTKLDIISKPSPLPFVGAPGMESDQDNELYVISNSALDDEILQKLKGKNLKSFEIKLHRLAGEALMQQQARRQQMSADGKSHPNHKPTLNKAMLNNINLLEAAAMLRQLRQASEPRRTADGKQAMSPSMSQKARLRVAASVAQLLAQAQQQAREQQLRAQAELKMKAQIEQLNAQSEQQSKSHSGTSPKSHSDYTSKEFQMKLHAEKLRAQAEKHLKTQTESHRIYDQQSNLYSEQPSTSNQLPQIVPPPPPLPTQPPPPLSPRDSPTNTETNRRFDVADDESLSTEENNETCHDSTVPVKEDGESSSGNNEKSPGTYDNFLEATGLSQKSIMTPSRMLNNHRSVVKPKDVKLRNKVRNAAIFERTIPPQVVGPTIKYWTEPYL